MHFPVFSRNSNPSIDRPLCRKSKFYVLDLLKRGDAVALGEDLRAGVKLLAQRQRAMPMVELKAALNDWQMIPVSFLPHGQALLITTEQLRTA